MNLRGPSWPVTSPPPSPKRAAGPDRHPTHPGRMRHAEEAIATPQSTRVRLPGGAADLPATWGIPWADPEHLTMSFAPDGTNVFGQSNTLFGTLNAQLGAGTWETTILKAVQTWASNANINVGLVSDGGEAIGTAGPAGRPAVRRHPDLGRADGRGRPRRRHALRPLDRHTLRRHHPEQQRRLQPATPAPTTSTRSCSTRRATLRLRRQLPTRRRSCTTSTAGR